MWLMFKAVGGFVLVVWLNMQPLPEFIVNGMSLVFKRSHSAKMSHSAILLLIQRADQCFFLTVNWNIQIFK